MSFYDLNRIMWNVLLSLEMDGMLVFNLFSYAVNVFVIPERPVGAPPYCHCSFIRHRRHYGIINRCRIVESNNGIKFLSSD